MAPAPKKTKTRQPRSPVSHYVFNQKRDPATQAIFNEFGRRLQSELVKRNWSQSELARRISERLPPPSPGQKQGHDFGRDRISHYIRGISLPRPEALSLLAQVLDITPDDLLPPGGNPAARRVAPLSMQDLGDGRCALNVNQVVSSAVAMKIIRILSEADNGKK